MSGVYIHIPFCHSKCGYCDFCSRTLSSPEMAERLIDRLVEEYAARCSGLSPTTLYIGGGTPSLLTPKQMEHLVSAIDLGAVREFTVEANPEDVTREWARAMRSLGVGRVSMGVQSLDDDELRRIGRRHTVARALEAFANLRSAGFDNISLDLIYGLPGQTLASWERSLRGILDLHPEHLSCYHLSYEDGTRLTAQLKRGLVAEASEELSEQMYRLLCDATRQAGYEHYEISNFALTGHRAVHNSGYWDFTPYFGLGPGAHSYIDGERSFHSRDILAYLREGYSATLTQDPESDTSEINDYIITRLRTADGLSLSRYEAMFGSKEQTRLINSAGASLRLGHLTLDGDTLAIPEQHWLISDAILLDVISG